MDSGQLVPDDIVEEIVKRRLDDHDWNYGFILDGFPRNKPQATFFLESYDIDAVIWIDVPDDVVFQRMQSRRLCAHCGVDYNLIFHRPAVPDTCDVCGGPLVKRADDNAEAIMKRLKEFHEKTQPILDLFRKKELIVVVDGTNGPADVQADIQSQLGLDKNVELV